MQKLLSLTWDSLTRRRQLKLWSLYLGSDMIPRWQQIPLKAYVPETGEGYSSLDVDECCGRLNAIYVSMSMEEGLVHWEKLSDIELLALPSYVDLRGRSHIATDNQK